MTGIPSVPSELLSKTVLEIEYEDTHQPSGDPSRPLSILLCGYYKVAPSKYEPITADLEKEYTLNAVFTCSALFLEPYKKVVPPGTWEGLDDLDGRQLLIMEAAKTINPPPTGKFQLVIRNKDDNKLNVRVLKFPKFPWWKKDPDPNPIELSDTIEAHSEKTFIVDFGRQVALWYWKPIE